MCGCGGQLGFGRVAIGFRHVLIGTRLHEMKGAFISHYPVSGFCVRCVLSGVRLEVRSPILSTTVSLRACNGSAFDTHGVRHRDDLLG